MIHPIVIAPTYNNARMLYDVLQRVMAQGVPVLVVNDGSTDDTPAILSRWLAEQNGKGSHDVLMHPVNRGKADALRTGFAAAARRGFTHAVTIDTDGQLDPAQIPDLLAAAEAHPAALIVGNRDETAPDYPAKSRTGRRISNLMVRLESGLRVPDSQCGYRVYPLPLTQQLPCIVGRYGYETEILTRAAWAGIEVIPVPVRCAYDIPGGRISHLRPTKDTLRGVRMHLWLLGRSCLPFVKRLDSKKRPVPTGTIWKRLLWWSNPVRAWQEVKHEEEGRAKFAASMALGVFIANTPVYGLHTIMCLYFAKKLKLHPVPAVVGSHIATPPLSAVLIVAGIAIGHLVLYGSWPTMHNYHTSGWHGYVGLVKSVMGQWCLGSTILGVAMAAATYGITLLCLHFAAPREDPGGTPREGVTEKQA